MTGSKRDFLINALIADWTQADKLAQSLGWKAHTLRGAISTAARKAGMKAERRSVDGVTEYRLVEAAQ